MTGLRVNGIRVGLMLGPESELIGMAERAHTSGRGEFERVLASFAAAEVLFDKAGIWPGVLRALRDAAQKHGITASDETASLPI